MDLDALPALLTARTKAIVPVHLYGNAVDAERVVELADGCGIAVVEDCAQAHGALLRGRHVGTFGNAATFSFYPTKNLGAFGDGGLCASRDPRVTAEMRKVRYYGMEQPTTRSARA
jgi:aminotransferase EvaB